MPNFQPAGYVSARGVPVQWTKDCLKLRQFPGRSKVKHVHWGESKMDILKSFSPEQLKALSPECLKIILGNDTLSNDIVEIRHLLNGIVYDSSGYKFEVEKLNIFSKICCLI